jgi:protein-L-isoaspartate(D-aspartate) O-methyltransferase
MIRVAMKPADPQSREQCRRLLAEINAEALAVSGRSIDRRVLEAMVTVPREEFVPPGEETCAYANVPLPIGHGQTISQPFIVAFMTDRLQPAAGDVVLEIGTGSGYQAAVLARLVKQVYSIEIIEALAEQARDRLARLGIDNVVVRYGDGHRGWPEHAPFDGIIVTAATPAIPQALVEQLAAGGRMVIPIGSYLAEQDLVLVQKSEDGEVTYRRVLPVAFVPLTGGS